MATAHSKTTIAPPLEKPAPAKPEPAKAPAKAEPVAEKIMFAGLVMEKTVDPETGAVKTKVLKQPTMSAEEIRATREVMKSRGG